MKTKYVATFSIILLLTACKPTSQLTTRTVNNQHNHLYAVSWFQHSGEMAALYLQGYNIATQRINEAIAAGNTTKPLAVVMDIDETILDNSPFEARQINKQQDFTTAWQQWTDEAKAKPLPGALEFTQYAKQKNVEVFYITNRSYKEYAGTLNNLQQQGFAYADDKHLITRGDTAWETGNTSSKAGRRSKVAENHTIIMLIGDNLNDFSEIFEDRTLNGGRSSVENNRELFGKKFIILPNPMYGAWEGPLYDYKNQLPEDQKTNLIKSKLKEN